MFLATSGVQVRPKKWVLPDRVGFGHWIENTFTYDDGDTAPDEFGVSLFPQQKFVRDYIQTDSPYAGLVLYHGVGVGKSCAAVAAIRALEANYRVIVMLPASIKKNFVTEMRKCGGHMYAEQQRWRRHSSRAQMQVDARQASASLARPAGKKASSSKQGNAEAWERHAEGTPFSELDTDAQQAIRDQLDRFISRRIHFISYNGISGKRVSEMMNSATNMFDGAAIIIDEVHNFISQVTNEKNLKLVYERIMAADPRKVILLTGTPFMNNVMEMPYLINLAHGFVRTVETQVCATPSTASSTRQRPAAGGPTSLHALERDVHSVLSQNPFINRYVVKPGADTTDSLTVVFQLTPNGFRREGDMYVTALTQQELTDGVGEANASNGRSRSARNREEAPARLYGAGKWYDFVRRHVGCELERVGVTVKCANNKRSTGDNSNKAAIGGMKARNKMLLPVGDAFLHRFTTHQGYVLKNVDVLARRMAGTVSYFGYYDAEHYPRLNHQIIVDCVMSGRQFDEYKEVRIHERKLEDAAAKFARYRSSAGESGNDSGLGAYRPRSRAVENFVFPPDVPRPQRKEIAEVADSDKVSQEYEHALTVAVETLRTERPDVMRMDGGLAEHSPKFYAMLRHFRAITYPVLVYSEFRKMEGIGILAACMDVNGYAMLYVKRQDGEYRVFETDPGHLEQDARVSANNNQSKTDDERQQQAPRRKSAPPRYMVFDNNDAEAAQIVLDIFNSEFHKLPSRVLQDLNALLPDRTPLTNMHGQLARALLVTRSGAEGINLKNVREVHVTEPFWNSNRVNQVVGRAVRAGSHVGLPEAERQVDVYIYMSVFAPHQAEERVIKFRDGGITSDQYVYRITQRKDALGAQVVRVMQRSAADCRLHEEKHKRINSAHECLAPIRNKRPDEFAYGFAFDEDVVEDANEEGEATRLVAVKTRDGRRFYMDQKANKLYEYEPLNKEGRLVEVVTA